MDRGAISKWGQKVVIDPFSCSSQYLGVATPVYNFVAAGWLNFGTYLLGENDVFWDGQLLL